MDGSTIHFQKRGCGYEDPPRRKQAVKVNRETLLAALKFASLGVSLRGETLEQSNTFVFTEKELITFNDEVMTRSPTPLPGIGE